MDEKKVSVVLAAFNAAKYLEEAIASILNQTFRDLELILIDDGSTDSTLFIMEKYARRDKRIRYYSQENSGPASARNTGIAMATGKWIAILDADDVALPNRLRQQLRYIETNPDILLLGSDCIEVDSAGNHIKEHNYPRKHSPLVRRMEREKSTPPHSSYIYHASSVRQLGGFNARFIRSQDIDLWLRLTEVGEIACLPQPLVLIRKHSEGISHSDSGRTQLVMGIAARICHTLRLRGFSDPSSADNETWNRFIHWLTHELKDRALFEQRVYWANARKRWYLGSHTNTAAKSVRLFRDVISSPYGLHSVWQRLFGSDLSARLADEWVRHSLARR